MTAHDGAEHAGLYPFAEAVLKNPALIKRVNLAHSQVNALMEHVRGQEGTALIAAMGQLQVAVTNHVGDEETHLLPALQQKATRAQLEALGARIEAEQAAGRLTPANVISRIGSLSPNNIWRQTTCA